MFPAENAAFEWFYNELRFDQPTKVYSLIKYVRRSGPSRLYYHFWQNPEDADHARLIVVPEAPVMLVHDKIKEFLMREFERKPWSYGFMGGSCEEAANRHKMNRSFLKFDVRHAFFQAGHPEVLASLSQRLVYGERHYGTISKWVARFIADLCTVKAWPVVAERYSVQDFLPQGSPTSPILFDIACGRLDTQMVKIAERIGGVYTRFADNAVVSMPCKVFPSKVRSAILCEAKDIYPIHKVSQSNWNEPFKMLGYQIADREVRMTRKFKLKLKNALYHLDFATKHGVVDERAVQIARGMMSFALTEHMSPLAMQAFLAQSQRQQAWASDPS